MDEINYISLNPVIDKDLECEYIPEKDLGYFKTSAEILCDYGKFKIALETLLELDFISKKGLYFR